MVSEKGVGEEREWKIGMCLVVMARTVLRREYSCWQKIVEKVVSCGTEMAGEWFRIEKENGKDTLHIVDVSQCMMLTRHVSLVVSIFK